MTSNRALVFVGTYNQPAAHVPGAHGRGLHVLDVDFAAGSARTRLVYPNITNSSHLCFDRRRQVLYTTSEHWGGVEGRINSLRFAGQSSTIAEHTELPSGGVEPCYVTLLTAECLLVANYGDGSLLSVTLRPDGHLASAASILRLAGGGGLDHRRQAGPHPHCAVGHPTNGRVYAADLGSDALLHLSVGVKTTRLGLRGHTATPPGSGPRHLVIDPSGTRLFCVYELSSRVGVFAITETAGLEPLQSISMLPQGFRGRSFGGDVVMTRDGAHVYATNRGHDSLAVYHVDPATGALVAAGWRSSGGRTPRSLALSPDGSHLVVANQDSDVLQVFEVSTDTGDLQQAFSVPVATPACVQCAAWPLVLEPTGPL